MRLRSKRILAKQKTTRYAGVSKKLYIKITFPYNRGAQATIEERKGDFMPKANSAAHTKWTCKYHIVFTPKYRRKIIYNQYKADLARILHDLCAYKGVEILEGHLMADHVHMLLEIPPKMKVSAFIGYLKGKSATMIYEQFGELNYKYRNREFWCKGYYIDTTGKNTTRIAEYIKHQLDEDQLGEQLSMPEVGPFKNRKRK